MVIETLACNQQTSDRAYKRLSLPEMEKVDHAVEKLLSSLEDSQVPQGLGLKRLQEDQWEIRVDLRLRVGFQMRKDLVKFGIVGDHDSIRKFLKNI